MCFLIGHGHLISSGQPRKQTHTDNTKWTLQGHTHTDTHTHTLMHTTTPPPTTIIKIKEAMDLSLGENGKN